MLPASPQRVRAGAPMLGQLFFDRVLELYDFFGYVPAPVAPSAAACGGSKKGRSLTDPAWRAMF
jgi:hypothetical protein